ncbi:MAG TPA: MMPL family transporter [Acidimicrobiales bacterium]|nr:MMPL family transporter [Acidimicrobiales bacterium]
MNPFASLGRFVVRFRWVIVVVWLVGAPLTAKHLPSLSSVAKNDNSAFLPANAPSEHAAELAATFQPKSKGTALLIAVRDDGPLTTADQSAIAAVESSVGHVGVVQAVHDQGTSADGEARKINLELNLPPFSGGDDAINAVDAIRKAMADTPAPPGLAFHLAGNIPTFVDEQAATGHTQRVTQDLAIFFIIALLLVVFRALLAPLVTLLPAALALVVAGPLIAEATHIGVQVSSLLQLLLVVIVLGAGTDYGLFLIFRMREELRAGRDPKDAVIVSVTRVGESITFSGVTVIAALVSLLLASFGLYRGLGPGLAIGIGVVLIANLTLLPALLALMGRAVFWPLVPTPGQTRRGVWGAVASRVVGRPVITLVVGVTAFGGLALAVLDYSPVGFGSPTVSATSDSARGQAALTTHFASAQSNPTNVVFAMPSSVWQHPAVLAQAESDLLASGVFNAVAGALEPIGRGAAFTPPQLAQIYATLGPPQSLPVAPRSTTKIPAPAYAAYRATAQFVSADGKTILYDTSLTAGGPETGAALNAIPRVRTAVASVAKRIGALDSGVAGEAPSLSDVASVSAHDLAKILPVVMLVLALLLALMLRSLVAPLYLVMSVALSYLAALGLAVLVFVIIGGQPGINFVLPFFMFIFIMALGEDYNILVMSRIREEAHTRSLPDAVRRAVQATGTTVTSAGLILAGTFAVLTATGGTEVREIGVGLAVGVLLDTFLVRTLLVPSTVVLLGRWNWWPSQLWHQHSIESVEGEPPAKEEEPAPVP